MVHVILTPCRQVLPPSDEDRRLVLEQRLGLLGSSMGKTGRMRGEGACAQGAHRVPEQQPMVQTVTVLSTSRAFISKGHRQVPHDCQEVTPHDFTAEGLETRREEGIHARSTLKNEVGAATRRRAHGKERPEEGRRAKEQSACKEDEGSCRTMRRSTGSPESASLT